MAARNFTWRSCAISCGIDFRQAGAVVSLAERPFQKIPRGMLAVVRFGERRNYWGNRYRLSANLLKAAECQSATI
ncbi:MAG: hypothetical protein KF723_20375 [Rhizobiaceae bacterium]|nr:hypothetical protein [Rhizobiaceae bacterium]